MKMLGSSVLPDLEETMNSVLPRSTALSIALTLRGIGAVQHVETRPTGLLPEGLAQHFRPEARSAHAEQHDLGETAPLHLGREALQPSDIGKLLLNDVHPADPFILVCPGPQRFVARPKTANASLLAPERLVSCS